MNVMQVSNVVRCLSSVVFLVTCITSTLTEAASYQKTVGTIVDPILAVNDGPYFYSGPDIQPEADLTGAHLRDADVRHANLTDALLAYADLAGSHHL